MDRLDEIRDRCRNATPGPWKMRPNSTKRPADAEFIAHCRNDLPQLLAALRAAQAVCDSLMEGAFYEESEMEQGVLAGHRSAALHVLAAIKSVVEEDW